MGCPWLPAAGRWYRGSGRRSPDGVRAHAEGPPGPGVMLGFGARAPFEDAVQGGPGVPPVVLPAEEFGDMPGHRIDPALVLGPAQLFDQVLREADRKLLRCGHTLVIPVWPPSPQPNRQGRGVLTGTAGRLDRHGRGSLAGLAGGVLTGMVGGVGAASATARPIVGGSALCRTSPCSTACGPPCHHDQLALSGPEC